MFSSSVFGKQFVFNACMQYWCKNNTDGSVNTDYVLDMAACVIVIL